VNHKGLHVMAWIFLLLAGLLEVVWSTTLKLSDGLTRPWPTAMSGVVMLASVGFLAVALRTLPLGVAYPIWTGIGAIGALVVGMAALGETASPSRVVAALLILAGIVLMKASVR
jgi:quaternary ammonium compound-resistance protein SugE